MHKDVLENLSKLDADCAERNAKWIELDQKVKQWESLLGPMPLDEARKAQLQNLKKARDKACSELSAAYNRRIEHQGSTMAPLMTALEKQDAKAHELQKLITELKQRLNEAESLRKDIATYPSVATSRADPNLLETDVDTIPSSSTKRRRLSSGYKDSPNAQLERSKEEMAGLHATLKAVVERVFTVENNMAAQEVEVREVMQSYIHDRAQEQVVNPPAEDPHEVRVKEIHGEVEEIGKQLSELSTWVKEIFDNNTRIEEEWSTMLEAKKKEEEEIQALLARVEEHEKNRANDKQEIEALSVALTLYREKPVSPPSSPFDPETIVTHMEDQIKQLVHNAVKPHIEEMRSALSEDMQRSESELVSTLWTNLSMTHKVIAAVAEVTNQPSATS